MNYKNILLFFYIFFLTASSAQTFVNKKLLASDGAAYDLFGNTISVNDSFIAIGASSDNNSNGWNAGSTYIFKKKNNLWSQYQKIIAVDGQSNEGFGIRVFIYDNNLVIGSLSHEIATHAGAVYIYNLQDSIWVMDTKITASDGLRKDYFGFSINMYKNNLIVGAYGYPGSLGFGKAYIYEKTDTGWVEIIGLSPKDLNGNDNFGYSVAITDSIAVIGAPQKSAAGSFSGSAYFYKYRDDNWELDTILIGSRVSANDSYGFAVTIDKNFVFITAPGNIYSKTSGSVYVFEKIKDTWSERDILRVSDGFNRDAFGSSIFIMGDSLLIGASNWNAFGYSGSAYLFVRDENNNWIEKEKFIPADHQNSKQFGTSVAMNNENFFFGAPWDNTNGYAAGAVYYYPDDPVSVNDKEILNDFMLYQNYPNPFNPGTMISYQLPVSGNVTLKVFDVLGREVAMLVNEYKEAGKHSVEFNAKGPPSGIYFYRLNAGSFSETKKMILLR